ncbi:gamma-glutamylcyclotransferase family protein [Nitratifractor sp.]
MKALLVYGSLVHPDEHRAISGLVDAVPLRLRGYRRRFTQRPSWREGVGERIAVARVDPDPRGEINLLCLLFETIDFRALDERERGYRRIEIDPSLLHPCRNEPLPDCERFFLYLGREELHAPELEPNPDYLRLCLEGARHWGEEFYRKFVESSGLAEDSNE